MEKQKNYPALRFSEFKEGWEKIKLGDIAYRLSTKNKEKKKLPIYSINNLEGFILQTEQFEGIETKSKNYDISLYKIIYPNTFAYNPARINVGSIGYSYDLREIIVSSLYVCFKIHEEYDDIFFLKYFKSNKFLKKVKRSTEGGVRQYLFFENFSTINEYIPPTKEEQEKIASFLVQVDDKINALEEKRLLLERYKKGIKQKLFAREIRFKDDNGNEYPDWKELKLKNFLKESRIKGDSGETAKKITVKLWAKGVIAKDEKSQGSANTQYYIRRAGQFVYSKLDFLNCAFGIIPDYLNGYQSTVDLPSFDISKDINSKFLLERVIQKDFYKKLGDTADGSRKAKRIHAETFLNFKIDVPCLEEQTKIAAFLTAIDQKINHCQQQIEQTTEWKKGLLQKMFV
jgi:type I restriction enzyme, S subunit